MKADIVFEVLGSIDEVSANIGLARSLGGNGIDSVADQLADIQSWLLDLGACVAQQSNGEEDDLYSPPPFKVPVDGFLEEWIDKMEEGLPALKNFILPGGGPAASALHVSRSVCRRAERCAVRLQQAGGLHSSAVRVLNRLSDYLFVCARHVARVDEFPEVVYRNRQKVVQEE